MTELEKVTELEKEKIDEPDELKLEDIEDFLKCDVCKDILNEPKTLLCQHTFCANCLISLKECPMCRLKLYLPKNSNNIFNNIISLLYGSEKVKELEEKNRKEKLEKELLPKVLNELNNNLNNTISNNGNNDNIQSYNNNDIDIDIDPVLSFWKFSIKLSTFNNIIKTIEILFLCYYLYTFVINYKNNNLSTYKILLNLTIICQSAYSIFSPKPASIMSFL
jgi:hypothetical protein